MNLLKVGTKLPLAEARYLQLSITRYTDVEANPCFPFGFYISPCGSEGIVVFSEDDAPKNWDLVVCNAMFLSPPGEELKVKTAYKVKPIE